MAKTGMTAAEDPNRRANGTMLPGNTAGFQPGQSANPGGAQLGAPQRNLTKKFVSATLKAFEKHGEAALEKVAVEQPLQFLQLCGRLVPPDKQPPRSLIDEIRALTPEDREDWIQRLRREQSEAAVQVVEHEE